MSQLFTTFGIDWHLLAFQTINFVVLAVALTWLLYKPVMKIVQERARVVTKGVEDAEAAAEKLSAADSTAHERVESAEKEAGEIVKRGRSLGLAEKVALIKEAETRAAQVERDAAARAAEEAARVLRQSENEIARLAMLAAEKVMSAKGGSASGGKNHD
ncbi:MAG: ATP synthase F0 subunit B [bacterium]|nr:ATP synthase F0 subunit B [bacterium]